MLNDKSRTLAYRNAILNNPESFKNKTVLDVGAGTGILSIFCAQAGAKKVYAVEASDLTTLANNVILENGLQDVITVIQSKIEDLGPESIEKVDIIVSEWMGFYLVHEGMLDSVLFARDHFLKENGILYPSIAKLYATPCELPSMYKFWDDICGVSMKCIGKEFRERKSTKPEALIINEDDILADSKLLAWLDLQQITSSELDSLGGDDYICIAKRDGRCQGICVWFSVEFPDGSELSTSPSQPPTHWKQIAVVLPTDMEVAKDEAIAFKLQLSRNSLTPRRYNMELEIVDANELEHEIPCNCHMTKCIVMRKYIDEMSSQCHRKDL